MSRINLLPYEIKEEINFSRRNKVIFNIFLTVIFSVLSLSAFSLYAYKYLGAKLANIETSTQQKELSIAGYGDLEKEAKNLNDRLTSYKKIDKEKVYWSKALSIIGENTPGNIYLTTIKANADNKTRGVITGNAENKLDIASFINSLKESGIFKGIDIEMVNVIADPFAARETNNFTINFSLDLDKLK